MSTKNSVSSSSSPLPPLPVKYEDLRLPDFSALEKVIEQYWREHQVFRRSVSERPLERPYVFYDGPPFATGMPHYGHLLGSTSKDVVARYWTMRGYRVERIWGWDCHGLPIENMIEGQLGITGGKKEIEARGIDQFNQACRSEVLRLDHEWERIISRLGRWVDFEHSYKTMDLSFMESVWWGFAQLAQKGLLYEDKKVILYCPRCATPLSNFEIAMDNSYQVVKETATTYKYPLKGLTKTYLLAWSTTPWNKLVTPALAINPELEYLQVEQGGEHYILAASTLARLKAEPYQLERRWTAAELLKLEFEPHYDFFPSRQAGERFGVIVADPFVTAEEGTGVVTLAVYGEDDYRVMKREGIQMPEHLDGEGRLVKAIAPWVGLTPLEVNPLVNAELAARGLIYSDLPYEHSLPLCYRCGTRLYHAPLPAWFINIQKLKPALLAANEQMNWYPAHLKHGRFAKGIEQAPDWNISRSRYWGTPMPVWRAESGETRIIASLAELKTWAVRPDQVTKLTDLHREFLDDLEVWVDDAKTIRGRRIPEVFDCWVESGSMPFASHHYPFENKERFEAAYPAQFVSEYIAQTRAWFYTVHVLSVAIFGQHAVENTLTTGTIMAADGTKMSKSKKNFPDPLAVMDEYGVDSLRLYLMSSPVMRGENINFNQTEIAEIRKRILLIWWNVFSFYRLYARGEEVKLDSAQREIKTAPILDRWLLSRLANLTRTVTEALDAYEVVRASRALMEFVAELSNWYLRTSRDRFREEETRLASLTRLGLTLVSYAQLMAPFTPFLSELIFQGINPTAGSVHLSAWPKLDEALIDEELEAEMSLIQAVAERAHALRREASLPVRQPLRELRVWSSEASPRDEVMEILARELNVKAVKWQLISTSSQDKRAPELRLELETQLTPELVAEGEARALIRSIQQLRKEAGLSLDARATVSVPAWPAAWQTEIEAKTKTQLIPGEKLALQT